MEKKQKIDYSKEPLPVRMYDARIAIQKHYLQAFPKPLQKLFGFFLKWQVILIITAIGPFGSYLMHGEYPRLGLLFVMTMMVEHHSYVFELFCIIMFYYVTPKQRQETEIALKKIQETHCLTDQEIKKCNRHVLLKIAVLAFFLGACGWAVAGAYIPVIINWIYTGVLIIPPVAV